MISEFRFPTAMIRFESPNQPEVVALIAELDAYQDTLYPPESRHALDLRSLSQPHVVFAVARDGEGQAIGCGAVVLGPDHGELKRMYVQPGARGQGVARRLLGQLESAAHARGCRLLQLETGPYQPEAIALYGRSGYERCGPFGAYTNDPLSVFMQKSLITPELQRKAMSDPLSIQYTGPMATAEERLLALGLTLPPVSRPRGNFRAYVISGSTLYLSGKGAPVREGGAPVPKVGAEVTVDQAQGHAREVALYLLALIKEALGSLERVQRVVKVFGMVNAVPDFTSHTEVINGCSDLLVAVLGERGEHARSAIGVGSLPKGFAVEIEAVVEFA